MSITIHIGEVGRKSNLSGEAGELMGGLILIG